jgi:hypothetical protein
MGAPIMKHMVVNNIRKDAKIKQKPVALKRTIFDNL